LIPLTIGRGLGIEVKPGPNGRAPSAYGQHGVGLKIVLSPGGLGMIVYKMTGGKLVLNPGPVSSYLIGRLKLVVFDVTVVFQRLSDGLTAATWLVLTTWTTIFTGQ